MTPDWNEGYPERSLDRDALEVILHTRWLDKERNAEPALYESKFWDYRWDHPVANTYLFGHVFVREVRRIIRAHIDDRSPKVLQDGRVLDWQPLKNGDFFEPPTEPRRAKNWRRKINALIRARQAADRCGVPYTFWCRRGLAHYYFGRNYVFEYRVMPGPDLLNGAECQAAIAEAWLDELGARIHHGTHPAYVLSEECSTLRTHPFVRAHQAFILDQIARKPDPRPALAKFIGMRLLGPASAAERFRNVSLPVPV